MKNKPKSRSLAIQSLSGHCPPPKPKPCPPKPKPPHPPSTKYVKILTIKDIPKKTIQNTTFSFSDIAKDVLKIGNISVSNKVVQKFIEDPLIYDYELVTLANRILTNIALNVINDPTNPPPSGYIKRATFISTDGDVFIDVTTYRNDAKAVADNLNLDSNVANTTFYKNIFNSPPTSSPIFNDNMLYPSPPIFLSPRGISFNSNNINPSALQNDGSSMLSTASSIILFSKSTYTWPADETKPPPTGGVATAFQTIDNHGSREEIQQARIQEWGYASRRSATIGYLPSYYVGHVLNLSEGWSLVLRVSYVKYK